MTRLFRVLCRRGMFRTGCVMLIELFGAIGPLKIMALTRDRNSGNEH